MLVFNTFKLANHATLHLQHRLSSRRPRETPDCIEAFPIFTPVKLLERESLPLANAQFTQFDRWTWLQLQALADPLGGFHRSHQRTGIYGRYGSSRQFQSQ